MTRKRISQKTWECTIEEHPEFGEYLITLPDDLLDQLGWSRGTPLVWSIDEQGRVMLSRADTDSQDLDPAGST